MKQRARVEAGAKRFLPLQMLPMFRDQLFGVNKPEFPAWER